MGTLRLAKVKTTPQVAKPEQMVSKSVSNIFLALHYSVFYQCLQLSVTMLTLHYRFYHRTQIQAMAHSYRIEIVRLQVNQHRQLTLTL
jgi:hypothetical protein